MLTAAVNEKAEIIFSNIGRFFADDQKTSQFYAAVYF